MSENLPPLRIRESDGNPNVIPVYEIILSNNLALINNGGGKVTLTAADSLAVVAYASTGNRYVVVSATPDLPNEEVLTQSTGILVTSGGAGGNILVSVSPLVVRTDRTINTTLPLSGGGTLAADRTLTIVNANANTTGALTSTDWSTFNSKNPAISWPIPVNSGGTFLTAAGSQNTLLGVGTDAATLEYKRLVQGANITISHAGTAITIAATTGAAAAQQFAATGNLYVLMGSASELTNYRLLTESTGILVNTGGALGPVYISVSPYVVNTGRTITTTYPVIGGGNFSADRTFTIDTAFLVNSGRTINTTLPLSGGGTLAGDLTFTIVNANATTTGALANTDWAFFNAKASTATTISAGAGLSGGGDLSANRTIALVTPVHVASGGIGVGTLTNYGILYGQSNAPLLALAALKSGQLLVGSAGTAAPYIFGPGSDGQMLLAQSGAVGGFVFANTIASVSATSTTTLCKAWFSAINSASTILGSYNISSLTRSGIGIYVANFTSAFATTAYTVTGSGLRPGAVLYLFIASSNKSVNSCNIIGFDGGSVRETLAMDVTIFGGE